jgi:ring-1,2-phenylacetyl-CoA epoxidase subunit PaaD
MVMKNKADDTVTNETVVEILRSVTDPEIPVLNVIDLGIIRKVTTTYNDPSEPEIDVDITPTYSGCPAMDVISMNIRMALMEKGFRRIRINTILSPAWTTDWMTEEGKEKLRIFGIAPPGPVPALCEPSIFATESAVECPRCGSFHTTMVSRFGSTLCKSQYCCIECSEPFDHFKCH